VASKRLVSLRLVLQPERQTAWLAPVAALQLQPPEDVPVAQPPRRAEAYVFLPEKAQPRPRVALPVSLPEV